MQPKIKKTSFAVKGMHCASCAIQIGKSIEKIDGVTACKVNYASEKAFVEYDESKVDISKMNDQIKKLGYSFQDHGVHAGHDMGTPISTDETAKAEKLRELSHLRTKVATSAPMVVLSILVMIWEIGASNFGFVPKIPEVLMMIFSFVLPIFATYMVFIVGSQYLQGIVRFIKYKSANMDTLVGIGTLTAYLYSVVITIFSDQLSVFLDTTHTYYDVAIVVIGFITLGKYLESRSKLKTGEAIQKLLGLQVKSAVVIRGSKEIEIPIEEVVVGDIMLIKPGQKIALDGVVVEGKSSVDESMITGESLPIDKVIGSFVIGSTINKQGVLHVKASKIGSETMLSQIIKMVEEAQGSKAPIEHLVDKVSAVFVPVVLIFALTTLVVWTLFGSWSMAIVAFVGVLVIACPCAMGLATPTAVIVGVGKAAQNGILIKNAESLQKFSSVDYIVFDKTGTLTKGAPEVVDFINVSGAPDESVVGILGSIEKNSEHPLSLAIVDYAKKLNIKIHKVDDFEIVEGKGIKARISEKMYYAGSSVFASELKVKTNGEIIKNLASEGKTPIVLMTKSKILAYIGVADTIKDEAKDTVSQIHGYGVKTAMLTGDNAQTAEHIANQLGIDRVIAQVLPADKANEIKKLQTEGYKVAMVGDGVNDAPALAISDVGVAMGSGTDVAIESAGITLLGGNIAKLPQALKLSKSTMKTIKQNLFWAFIYNIIGIPIAAGVLYPFSGIILSPAIAGAAMGLSSVSVVLNALRLKKVKL